jgi:hypothetical protein
MERQRLGFVDWMKCAGISVIVLGHVAGRPINLLTPPIYPKQLGVAFFMFVIGFSLSRETRAPWRVVLNRLFEIYLFGVIIAVMLTAATWLSSGSLALSNYLPFVGGANVLFNNFPANPTTWYIGTYLHILLIWAIVLRRVKVGLPLVLLVAAIEIPIRAWLVSRAGAYIGYMLFTNWMTVLLLGTWCGRTMRPEATDQTGRFAWPAVAGMALLAAAWAVGVGSLPSTMDFPFMHLSLTAPESQAAGSAAFDWVSSSAVTFLYSAWAWLIFMATRRAQAPAAVRFIARNTIVVFIGHMPLFYLLDPYCRAWPYYAKAPFLLATCLVGVAVLSELANRLINPRALRARLLGAEAPEGR